MTYALYTIRHMASHDLATPWEIVMTKYSQNIPVTPPEGLKWQYQLVCASSAELVSEDDKNMHICSLHKFR